MNAIFISPHNDDEALFGAYTLMRSNKIPVLVVTDSYIQKERGDGIGWWQRREETSWAMKMVGSPVIFGGIADTEINEQNLSELLRKLRGFDFAYIPAVQGGNRHHDLIGSVAPRFFKNHFKYTTYTPTELWTTGDIEIVPTKEEMALKNKMLDSYQTQIQLRATAPHFLAVRNRSEWLIK